MPHLNISVRRQHAIDVETGDRCRNSIVSDASSQDCSNSTTGFNQENDDRLGAPDLLSSLTGFGGSAVNKTSQAGSFLTGGLRPDAKAELDEKEEISQTGSIQEDDDRLGAPDLLSSLTGFGGSAVNKTSQAGSFLTGGLRPDALAHPTEQAGTCTKQTNPLADFRAAKLTCKDAYHSSRDYISNTKERSATKTNTIGEGGNTTQGIPESQAANDLPTKASEKKTSLKFGGNTTRGSPASQVTDDPFTEQSEPKTNAIGECFNTARGSSDVIQSVSTTPFPCSGSLLFCPLPPRESWRPEKHH